MFQFANCAACEGHRRCAQVAQSVEHVLGKDEVGGSIPLLGFVEIDLRVRIDWESNNRANHELAHN